jgi:hypothetical protein
VRAVPTLLVGLVGLVGCKAREDAFYSRVFSCERNAGGDVCGTTRYGKPMTCFAASQLGGENFCVEACDPGRGSDDPRFVCLSSGALLQVCRPHAGATDQAWACPAGLECYRTDLLYDEGVCIQMRVCTEDSQCGEQRPVCAARLIRERSGPSLPIHADNLQCVQSMCGAGKAMCPPGEQCLAGYYDGVTSYDVCVPDCDGSLQCPPNFACATSPSASGSPSLCLPGVPGIRCHQEQDCVAGNCLDTGAGFKMCVLPLPCRSNQDCAMLSGHSSTFLCAEIPGAGKRCLLRETFNGTNCADAAECPDGFICTAYTSNGDQASHGDCRLACGGGDRCPVRGGIPHVCLGEGRGGCYPTGFAVPCAVDTDCLPELTCLAVGPDERSHISSATLCTTTCATDSDCRGHPLIRHAGFCRQDEGLCRWAGSKGDPCERDAHCAQSLCAIGDTGGPGQCLN